MSETKTVFYYDTDTDTVRKYGHLTAGEHIGERWDKVGHVWTSECCPRSGCHWDEVITEDQAKRIVERQ